MLVQYIVPHHLFSRVASKVMNIKTPLIRTCIIKWFIKRYGVDLSLAVREKPEQYTSFNDFFTRQLKANVRPMAKDKNILLSPVDGYVSVIAQAQQKKLIQAKGAEYSLENFLGNDKKLCDTFSSAQYATLYLAPKDYHCVHMPIDGQLKQTIYVPGRLFSVNLSTSKHVPGLFARNERLICEFETKQGPMLIIFVGAMIVAGINTVWGGQEIPADIKKITYKNYTNKHYQQGDKIGHFNVGSTIILMMASEKVRFLDYSQRNICFGATIADIDI